MTPEGRVKKNLKDFLKKYERKLREEAEMVLGGKRQFGLYSHWPVLNGMGSPELDCNIVFRGRAISIECKAPGKMFSARQMLTTEDKQSAGCIVLGYRGVEHQNYVEAVLNAVAKDEYIFACNAAKEQLQREGFLDV